MANDERPVKQLKTSGEPWEDDFRLPLSVHPDHYDLFINPDLNAKTFEGEVTIHVTSSEARDYFLVHTKFLNITSSSLIKVDGENFESVPLAESFEYKPNEFWVIKTSKLAGPGKYQILLKFNGSLDNGIVGFYYSDYVNEDGKNVYLATTKFEPTFCRRAFPSFDEPTFKSTYNISIMRPSEGYIALSNMPVLSEVENANQGLTKVIFEKSVPMVTYLVCFIVCDFTYKEQILSSGMPFRVYGTREKIDNVEYALETGAKILQHYEKMFDIPFPLPKSDMAAIPDYSSGATEHWGIITYRETNLLYNASQSSAANNQRVSKVIAHELAHQWFGNLVTLNWWNDLWLNEGFASYIESKGVDFVHPEWDMPVQFSINNLQRVFDLDSKLSSHPIVQQVNNPDQINAMFDLISYQKGASVLRMLEYFLSEKVFQQGVNSFLKRFSYDNAVTQDLWDELTAAWKESGVTVQKSDVGEIMNTWTKQMGYPVITVKHSSPDKLELTQSRFLIDPQATYDPSESEYEYKWDIPITYITSSSTSKTQHTWFYREQDQCEILISEEEEWYKLNIDQQGYYRVNYESNMWDQLENVCDNKNIGPGDRGSLYDDAFALADASLLPYEKALNLSRALKNEDHYVPWVAVSKHIDRMVTLLYDTDVESPLKEYLQGIVTQIYNELGWLDEGTHLDKLLRNQIVSLSCVVDLESCLIESSNLLQSWIDDSSNTLPIGTRRQIYRRGLVKAGSVENWNEMWKRCLETTDATERDNLYYGLANSQDQDILARYIKLAQDEKNVRTQDFLHVIKYISLNPAGSDFAWKWVRDNWEWLVNLYTLNDRYLGQLIPDITQYFATEEKLQEMNDFFTKYPEAGAGVLYRKQAIETVKFNIRWVKNHKSNISEWLQN